MKIRFTNMARLATAVTLAMLVFAVSAASGSDLEQRTKDNLQKAQTIDEKMKCLGKLADMNFSMPAELGYLKQLYQLSRQHSANANAYKAMAISHICRYYFNANDLDSVVAWAEKFDEVRIEPSVYSRYFDTKYYQCSAFLDRGNTEKALGNALDLQKDAQRLRSEDGEVTCYELLGDVYMKTSVLNQAIDAYSCGHQILKKQGRRATYRFQLLTQILECYVIDPTCCNADIYLKEMQAIFQNGEIPKSSGFLYERCLKLYYAYSLLYSVNKKDEVNANHYYSILSKMITIDDWFVEGRTTRLIAEYFQACHRYNEALKEICKLDSFVADSRHSLLYTKGQILENLKRYKEATSTYYLAYDTLQSEYNKSILSDFSQFQDICHEQYVSRLHKEYMAERQRNNIVYTSVFLVIALVMLALFGYHVRRSSALGHNLALTEQRLRADETELLQRQAVLREALEKHMKNGRMKSTFLSNMSHEIRTPLNAIVGFSNLLAENAGDNVELRDYANIIRSNSDSLMVLINNILSLGRIDSNRVVLTWNEANLVDIINSAMAPYVKPEVEPILQTPSNNITIVTDALRLGKVFDNVYSNAFKFTKKGHVKTVITLNGSMVNVRIEDTGIGVPNDKKELIFERFEKVDTFMPGSGLGLSICRELLKRMGGTITVDKDYTTGLAVIIDFPIKPQKSND
ncbi:MAG: ATP-binding protein [Muribaculaceae bacterium]